MTGLDICTQAMQRALLLSAGATIRGDQAPDVLAVVNQVLDDFQADQRFCYGERFDQYAIIPNHNPHTIGPTGDFVTASRPITIDAAAVVDTSVSPNVKIPMRMVDWQWYWRQAVPGTTATYEIIAYYQPDMPNGSLYLWPVPTTAYKIELWTKTVIAQLTLTGTFQMPPGYWSALVLTAAENLCPLFDQDPPAMLISKAAAARQRVFGNIVTPRLATRDAGMPQSSRRVNFNWQTGLGATGRG